MRPEFVKKSWGWELWFANVQDGPDYCGKVLYVYPDKWSSEGRYHYHKIKDETFFVVEGALHLVYFDERSQMPTHVILKQNESFRIKPGVKHKFTAAEITGCKFIEVSTFHSDDDSYRCTFDIESGEWMDYPK